MSNKKPSAWLDLDQNTLESQRAVRNDLKRETTILMCALILGLILLLFGFRNVYLAIPFLIAVYVISNWRQWNALLKYDLHCPHCDRSLADNIKLHKSPSHNCVHCGKRALATIKQLKSKENAF